MTKDPYCFTYLRANLKTMLAGLLKEECHNTKVWCNKNTGILVSCYLPWEPMLIKDYHTSMLTRTKQFGVCISAGWIMYQPQRCLRRRWFNLMACLTGIISLLIVRYHAIGEADTGTYFKPTRLKTQSIFKTAHYEHGKILTIIHKLPAISTVFNSAWSLAFVLEKSIALKGLIERQMKNSAWTLTLFRSSSFRHQISQPVLSRLATAHRDFFVAGCSPSGQVFLYSAEFVDNIHI